MLKRVDSTAATGVSHHLKLTKSEYFCVAHESFCQFNTDITSNSGLIVDCGSTQNLLDVML